MEKENVQMSGIPTDELAVFPQALEIVVLASSSCEDVDDDVSVVEEDPSTVWVSLGTANQQQKDSTILQGFGRRMPHIVETLGMMA